MYIDSANENSLEEAYLLLRKAVGLMGMALPFVVALGAMIIDQQGLQSSISSYYHTVMGDVFVGTLCAIGFFMYSYRGFERIDDITGTRAAIFAIGVALFPTKTAGAAATLTHYLHLAFTVAFFWMLINFCLKLFVKTNPEKTATKQKLQRNQVYKTCGWIMVVCMALIVIYTILPDGNSVKIFVEPAKPVFWLEAIAILVFGISWFTKGEAIPYLKDR